MTGIENEQPDAGGAPAAPSSAEVGARVSAVLTAAEEAAATMRREAEAGAQRILREAEDRGLARVEELTGEPERLRAEAEADATRIRKEASDEAAATRQRSAQERELHERDLEERRAQALDELGAIENERQKALAKLQRALAGLRGTSSQLEEVIGTMNPNGELPKRRGLGALLGRSEPDSHAVYEALQQRVQQQPEPAAEPPSEQTTEIKEPPKPGKTK